MNQADGNAAPPSDRGGGARRHGASNRRALTVGLGASLVVHIALLAAYPRFMERDEEVVPLYLPPVPGVPADGMTVIRLMEVESGETARPPDPTQPRVVEQPAVEVGPPPVSEPIEGELVAPSLTVAERLRPYLRDARLWAPVDSAASALTPAQLAELRLAIRISEWNDSLAAEALAERALTDWTVTDGQGRKWGISQGRIHLGDITIPFPFGFGTPVGKRDEVARQRWEWEEIRRGAASGAVHDSWKDRARAIRERRDRERAQARGGAQADSIGGR